MHFVRYVASRGIAPLILESEWIIRYNEYTRSGQPVARLSKMTRGKIF